MLTRVLLVCSLIASAPGQETTIRTTVPLVLAPATVTDRQGSYVHGLTADDFLLTENGQPRPVRVDFTEQPISLVLAIQTSTTSEAALQKLRKIGGMIEPLVVGERGRVAVLTYDRRVRTEQEFTANFSQVRQAFDQLQPTGSGGCLLDAVQAGVRLLAAESEQRRRVLLVIGEGKDRGSETPLTEAVSLAQQRNVIVYVLTYSAFLTPFTAKGGTLQGTRGDGNLLAIFTELAHAAKTNAAEPLGQYTGGRVFSFLRQRGLEQVVGLIGEDLHSQYVLSFTPAATEPDVFHPIVVTVRSRPDALIRTRPGYWLHTE